MTSDYSNTQLPKRVKDMAGQTFRKLTVLAFGYIKNHSAWWKCLCECGNTTIVQGASLRNGHTKSCGCLYTPLPPRPKRTVPVMSEHPLYDTWKQMRHRCNRPSHKMYPHYGGRGIKVCDRWNVSFRNFLADMGDKPSPAHSLDRINNDGDYCPENCRWATQTEQTNNTRRSHLLTLNGKTQTVSQWARELGVHRGLFFGRLKDGWSDYDTLTIPVEKIGETKFRKWKRERGW